MAEIPTYTHRLLAEIQEIKIWPHMKMKAQACAIPLLTERLTPETMQATTRTPATVLHLPIKLSMKISQTTWTLVHVCAFQLPFGIPNLATVHTAIRSVTSELKLCLPVPCWVPLLQTWPQLLAISLGILPESCLCAISRESVMASPLPWQTRPSTLLAASSETMMPPLRPSWPSSPHIVVATSAVSGTHVGAGGSPRGAFPSKTWPEIVAVLTFVSQASRHRLFYCVTTVWVLYYKYTKLSRSWTHICTHLHICMTDWQRQRVLTDT